MSLNYAIENLSYLNDAFENDGAELKFDRNDDDLIRYTVTDGGLDDIGDLQYIREDSKWYLTIYEGYELYWESALIESFEKWLNEYVN